MGQFRQSAYSGRTGTQALFASAGALCVLLAVMAAVTLTLRENLRAQILGRDAAVLSSVAVYEAERTGERQLEYTGSAAGESDRVLDALLDVSRLDGVVALRVFDENGNFSDAAPAAFARGGISPDDLARVRTLHPVSHFHPDAHLDAFFVRSGQKAAAVEAVPLLEVIVPVYTRSDRKLMGIGQFLLDGAPTAGAFAELDRNLMRQAGAAFAAAILLGGGLIGWSLWKLHRGNILLLARTRALASANRELALRSRVSAIGAVTANLLHGLKNPLAALSMYVEERRRSEEAGDDGSGDAGEAVRRMGRMIEESVAILAQEVGGEKFDYSLAEIAEVVKDRCAPRAAGRGVAIATEPVPEGQMDNRSGNLLTLAAVNLVTNAIEASAPGSSVGISWSLREPDAVAVFSVTDSGPGLPDSMREDPFRPVHSSKEGGSGVGLAIAAQLVSQMGGSIRLDATGPKGSVFSITFQLRGWRGVDEVR